MTALVPITMFSFLLLPTALAAPVGAETGAGSGSTHKVAFEVDGKRLLDDQIAAAAEDTTFFVRASGTKALNGKHGVEVAEDDASPAISVHLSWASYEDSIYAVRIETRRAGQPSQLVESFECECANSELAAAVTARLPAALQQLGEREVAEAAPTVEPEPTEPTAPGEHVVARTEESGDNAPRRPLGTFGRAGISVAAVGAAALIGGGVVFAQGRKTDEPAGRAQERTGRDFEPPGVVSMVAGGAAVVTGTVLLIVDRRRARRASQLVVLPSSGGFVVTGRF